MEWSFLNGEATEVAGKKGSKAARGGGSGRGRGAGRVRRSGRGKSAGRLGAGACRTDVEKARGRGRGRGKGGIFRAFMTLN